MTSGHQTLRLDLEAFDGRIDIARRAARGRLLAQHVPGLQRRANFKIDAAALDAAAQRKAEFALRLEPEGIDGVSRAGEIGEHPEKVFPGKMRQHETVVQIGAPTHGRPLLRFAPEPGEQRAHQ